MSESPLKSMLAWLSGIFRLLMARGSCLVLVTVMTMVISVSLCISLALLSVKLPETSALYFGDWEQACQQTMVPGDHQLRRIAADTVYPGDIPGVGKYRALHRHYPCGTTTLAELILVYGRPERVGCLDSSPLNGKPMIWVRLVFKDGRTEAYVALEPNAQALRPADDLYALFFYDPDDDHPLLNTISWPGFASLNAYENCG